MSEEKERGDCDVGLHRVGSFWGNLEHGGLNC